MALTKQELILWERAKRAGAPVRDGHVDGGFNFTISPITTDSLDVRIFINLGRIVEKILSDEERKYKINGIVLFPIICNNKIYVRKDFITYRRSENSYFVGTNIDYTKWVRSERAAKVGLAVKNLEASLERIPEMHFLPEEKMQCSWAVRMAADEV